MTRVRQFLTALVDCFPAEMRPTATSPLVAAKVFAIPELLEKVFHYLSPRQLLAATRFSRTAWQIFNSSPKLQDTLQLRPHPDGHLKSELLFTLGRVPVAIDGVSGWGTREYGLFNRVPICITFVDK